MPRRLPDHPEPLKHPKHQPIDCRSFILIHHFFSITHTHSHLKFLDIPISRIHPISHILRDRPDIPNPVANDPDAAQRGMRYFNQFNCVGCHAPNGAGGMGPSLSDIKFIYGREPENIYLTIVQGRPKGMPSWGGRLPDNVIWDIVAYVRSISQAPSKEWGQTISVQNFQKQQVPTEYLQSATPWKYMTPFTFGQKPFTKPKSGPPPAPQH